MSTNVSSVTSHFPSAQNGFTTTLASTIASGASTVPLNSVAGYTNGQTAVFVVDPSDAAKKQTFTGIIDTSGVQLTSVVWTAGTNQTHTGGAIVVDYATATHISMVSKGILVHANADGTIKAGAINTAAQIADGTISNAKSATSIQPVTLFSENTFDHVVSGCVWTADAAGSTRLASMISGVVMLGGKRLTVAAVTSRTFTASKDVYVGFIDAGDGTATVIYFDNTTNAASPSLATAAYTMVDAIVVVGASSITTAASINQGQETALVPIISSTPLAVTDSIGNLICPRDAQRRILGYRMVTADQSGITTIADGTGLNVPVIVPTGRKIIVKGYSNSVNSVSDAYNQLFIFEGATQLQSASVNSRSGSISETLEVETLTSPSAGLHTYKLSAIGNSSGSGSMTIKASITSQAFVRVELA